MSREVRRLTAFRPSLHSSVTRRSVTRASELQMAPTETSWPPGNMYRFTKSTFRIDRAKSPSETVMASRSIIPADFNRSLQTRK